MEPPVPEIQRRPFAELTDIVHRLLIRPHTVEELAGIIVGATPGDDPYELIDELIMTDERFGWAAGEVLFRPDMLLAGHTVTHRVTAEDVAEGRLPDSAGLSLIADLLEVDEFATVTAPIADGPALELIHADEPAPDGDNDGSAGNDDGSAGSSDEDGAGSDDEDGHGHHHGDRSTVHRHYHRGPQGWLDQCVVGSLCGFRVIAPDDRDDLDAAAEGGDSAGDDSAGGGATVGADGAEDRDRCRVEFVPVVDDVEADAAAAFVDAVGQAVGQLVSSRSPVADGTTVLTQILLDHPGLFEVLPPLEDAALDAGLSVRDHLVAQAGHDWDAAAERNPVDGAASYFRLEPSSRRHLERAHDAFTRWQEADPSDRSGIIEAAPAGLIPDTFVAEAFGASIVGYVAEPGPEARAKRLAEHRSIGDFAAAVQARNQRTGRAGADETVALLWLQAVTAAATGDGRGQVELLQQAHRLSPTDPVVAEDLAYCRVDQSRYLDAYRLLAQVGADGPVMTMVSELTLLSRTRAGRNDPCPCGSGRKFKQCHGGGRAEVSAADAASALYQKPIRLLSSGEFDLPDWNHWPAAWADDELSVREWRAGLNRLDDLGVLVDILLAEGGTLNQFLEARAGLVPADEAAVAARWAETPRSLFRVVSGPDDDRLVLENAIDGSSVDCTGDPGAATLDQGDLVVARPAPIGGGLHRLFGGGVSVPSDQVDELQALFDDPDRSAESTARALARIGLRARAEATESVLWFAAVRADDPEARARWEQAEIRYDQPTGELMVGATNDGDIVIRSGDMLALVTYSREAHDAQLAGLTEAIGRHEVVARHAVTADALQQEVLMLNRDLLDGPPVPHADPKGEFDSAILTRILETGLAMIVRAEGPDENLFQS